MDPETPSPALPPDMSRIPRMSSGRPVSRFLLILLTFVSVGTLLLAQGKPPNRLPGGPQPAFGILTATPPNFVFDTPTTVTFTIPIDTPTLNPTTVELQRVDASGQFQSTIARILDNGRAGDRKAGDRVFTVQLTLNESAVGRLYFRVAAAFRGNSLNAQSALGFVDVDPFPLPPDPGEAGEQSLVGIDSDNDGVRDDFQRYVAYVFPNNDEARAAAHQYGSSMQVLMTSSETSSDDESVAKAVLAGDYCLMSIFGVRAAHQLHDDLKRRFLNTSDRQAFYRSFQLRLKGMHFSSPQLNDLHGFCSPR